MSEILFPKSSCVKVAGESKDSAFLDRKAVGSLGDVCEHRSKNAETSRRKEVDVQYTKTF